jgi:hypothetical protein
MPNRGHHDFSVKGWNLSNRGVSLQLSGFLPAAVSKFIFAICFLFAWIWALERASVPNQPAAAARVDA